MTPELKERWAQELESGKWVQIQHRLRNEENGRCCLGVLAELIGGKRCVMATSSHPDDQERPAYSFNGLEEETGIPPSVLIEVGLLDFQQDEFIDWNDTKGYDFETIARRVRALR